MELFLVSTLCLLFAFVGGTPFRKCDSSEGAITAVDVQNCNTPICDLPHGANVSVAITFTTKEAVQKVTSVVHGIIAGVPVPFPLKNPDGCTDSGLTCPLKSGGTFHYKTNIYVDTSYPKLKVVVKWELKDEKSQDLGCFEVGAQIVDAKARVDTALRFNRIH